MRSDGLVDHAVDALLTRNPALISNDLEDLVTGIAGQIGRPGGNMACLTATLSLLPVKFAVSTVNRY